MIGPTPLQNPDKSLPPIAFDHKKLEDKASSISPRSIIELPLLNESEKPPLPSDVKKIPSSLNEKSSSLDSAQTPPLTQDEGEEAFFDELESFIFSQAKEIEAQLIEFKGLQQNGDIKLFKDALMNSKQLGFDLFEFNDVEMQEGLKLLNTLLPREIINPMLEGNRMKFRALSRLGITLLHSISTKSKSIALVCKAKLIEESKNLLMIYKALHPEVEKLQSPQKAVDGQPNKADDSINLEEVTKWESHIEAAEKQLEEEKKEFEKFRITDYLDSRVISPLVSVFNFVVLKPLTFIFDLTWITKSFNVVQLGFELNRVRNENDILNQWRVLFQDWKTKTTPHDVKGIKNSNSIQSTFISDQLLEIERDKHIQSLFEIIQTKRLYLAKSKLRNAGIKIPKNIKTKEQLTAFLKTNTAILDQYVNFKQNLDALDSIIEHCTSLYKKRAAIRDKKILQITPRYYLFEPRIKAVNQKLFLRNIERLKEELEKPTEEELIKQLKENGEELSEIEFRTCSCNKAAVIEAFETWLYLDPLAAPENQKMVFTLKQYQEDKENNTPEIKQVLSDYLSKLLGSSVKQTDQFNLWFQKQKKEELIKHYIDHQETIELAIKDSLKMMIEHKIEIEAKFQSLRSIESHVSFSLTTSLLIASISLGVVGMVTSPLGGIGLIFLGLSALSTIVTLGFIIAGRVYAHRYKPNTTDLMTIPFQIKKGITNLRKSIALYYHKSKERKVVELAKILHQLHIVALPYSMTAAQKLENPIYQKYLKEYLRAKEIYDKSKNQVEKWSEKLDEYEKKVAAAEAKDVAFHLMGKSQGISDFNALDEIQNALKYFDFRLISKDTKSLFEEQLGINLENFQNRMRSHPDAPKELLNEFLALNGEALLDFILNQKKYINIKLNGPPIYG